MNGAPLLEHPRYRVGAELGRGAQGVVVRVEDREAPERALVAKVWRGRLDQSALLGEFSLLCRLDVPGLARAHDFGRDARSGAPFFVEDYIEGPLASEALASVRPNERSERLVQLLSEVASTLAALHESAFVHGDLKPAHVKLGSDGRAYLLDLGAAVTASHGARSAFTPAFAAPERLAGGRATPGSDLFSLGALAWCLVTGSPPAPAAKLRQLSPWVPPSLARIIEHLLAPHPRDRPHSAEEVLAALGQSGIANPRRSLSAPLGRERELTLLCRPQSGVRYVVGASGMGKSHLLRELSTRALLEGRSVRRLVFPLADARLPAQLVAFFRGESAAWPFTQRGSESQPLLLLLDELEHAPAEVVSALDAFRCRREVHAGLDVIAALRLAPNGAAAVELGPLDSRTFQQLCRHLGVDEPAKIAELERATLGNPGFLAAARGHVPLTRDIALERTRGLSRAARELLGLVALFGGALEAPLAAKALVPGSAAEAELFATGLLLRRADADSASYALSVRELSLDLAGSIASFELAERATELASNEERMSPQSLLALACGPFPPAARDALLERAAAAAQRARSESEEIEALLALSASKTERSPARLLRLERLTRSAGINHPQVLEWLGQACAEWPELQPLDLRRRAERAARSADFVSAEQLASEAVRKAIELGDSASEALAIGTRGAIALYRADVSAAESALVEARARVSTLELADQEELARLDHNLGVVSLYRDRLGEAVQAFERSLAIKRRLGDRAGVRACLLNLGLALARQGEHMRAAAVLDEALALARALGQRPGQAWCLAARADVEVRRGDAESAEAFVAEAEAISETPPAVRADLCLLRGQMALMLGSAERARAALGTLDPELRGCDALIDARARLIEAGALLASLPVDSKRAAQLAIRAARIARAHSLSEIEKQAVALYRKARGTVPNAQVASYTGRVTSSESELWRWLETTASGSDRETLMLELLRTLRKSTGAERAFLVLCTGAGPEQAFGVDLEDFALPSALERCDAELVRRTCAARSPVYERDRENGAGRGSWLGLPGGEGRMVLVLEHRFRTGCFDALSPELTRKFVALAGLSVRLGEHRASAAPALPAATAQNAGETTELPELGPRRHFPNIIGRSAALERALSRLSAAIDSDLPVFIWGETGTGKELFARALHDFGPRRAGPFVAVNCAAIPESLFEAELFGHARGAFTGAERARAGLLARAEGGTLFFDEIGELSPARQAALLRVLETRKYRAVGSDDERTCDVRVVSATHRDLHAEAARGAFRQDLLYRINVLELSIPALRERPEDVVPLVQAFLSRSGARVEFSPEALGALESYAWPGNVRELEHQVLRLVALGASRIELAHLPRALRRAAPSLSMSPPLSPSSRELSRGTGTLDERREVELALEHAQGNITHAARALGLTRHGLKKRMLRLGLRASVAERSSS